MLMLAALGCRADTVAVLMDAGAELDHRDNYGYTAVMSAAGNGDIRTVRV